MSSLPSPVIRFPSTLFSFEDRLQRAFEDMRAGRPIILMDDFDRENEADLVAAAETISVPTMALFIREGSGIVCLCMTAEKLDHLQLPQMVPNNESCYHTAFTTTIDARNGITTGVSAQDRVATIRAAVAPDALPNDLVRPGHVFPLRATPGGVLAREGHTEGSVDLAKLAGLQPAAVICEITNPDGSMAKGLDVDRFARRHDLVLLSISELVAYRTHCRETD